MIEEKENVPTRNTNPKRNVFNPDTCSKRGLANKSSSVTPLWPDMDALNNNFTCVHSDLSTSFHRGFSVFASRVPSSFAYPFHPYQQHDRFFSVSFQLVFELFQDPVSLRDYVHFCEHQVLPPSLPASP
mmetsp:Transcript_9989/g.11459  ORF Transcript_9989/g.11459 Transcript_9989/m.11459 type:complete len:129 (-) Transcript_9989:237-623(-)